MLLSPFVCKRLKALVLEICALRMIFFGGINLSGVVVAIYIITIIIIIIVIRNNELHYWT